MLRLLSSRHEAQDHVGSFNVHPEFEAIKAQQFQKAGAGGSHRWHIKEGEGQGVGIIAGLLDPREEKAAVISIMHLEQQRS